MPALPVQAFLLQSVGQDGGSVAFQVLYLLLEGKTVTSLLLRSHPRGQLRPLALLHASTAAQPALQSLQAAKHTSVTQWKGKATAYRPGHGLYATPHLGCAQLLVLW